MITESKASERAAWLAWQLASGERLRPVDIMEKTAVSRRTAYRDIDVLSRVLPIGRDDEGYYYLVAKVKISPY